MRLFRRLQGEVRRKSLPRTPVNNFGQVCSGFTLDSFVSVLIEGGSLKAASTAGSYGYRRVWALLRREGWAVNKKRVQRLWRKADLKVPAKERKRRRMGASEISITRKQAEYPGHVWSYDFAMDATEDGRRLKMMPIVEEYSRECLALKTERSITAESLW